MGDRSYPGMVAVLNEVAAERRRQVEEETCTAAYDDERNGDGQLAEAAACYAHATRWDLDSREFPQPPDNWPFEAKWWKPTMPRRDLIKAAALLVAEIERLDRAAPATEERRG